MLETIFFPVLIAGISVEETFLESHQKSFCVGNGETDEEYIEAVDSDSSATPGLIFICCLVWLAYRFRPYSIMFFESQNQ